VAVKILPYWPQPNRPGHPLTGQENFVGSAGLPHNDDEYALRVDHNLHRDQRLFARWSQKRQYLEGTGKFFGRDNPAGMGIDEHHPRWDIGLGYTYTITPRLLLNATLGWNRWVERIQAQGAYFRPSSLGLPAALDTFGGPGAFPAIAPTGVRSLGAGGVGRTAHESRTYALDLTCVPGRHALTFGFMAIDFRFNSLFSTQAGFTFPRNWTQGPKPTAAGPTTGNGVASFLLGAGSGGITYPASPAFNKNFYGWCVNDDWKLGRSLTLNLGLRFDFQKAPRLRFSGDGNPRGVYDPHYFNLAPRIGLTWSPVSRCPTPSTARSPPAISRAPPWLAASCCAPTRTLPGSMPCSRRAP
jgi:hypothetical protein